MNVLNQYPSVNGSPLYYDTRGNLNGNTATPTFGYDPENRLMGAAIAGLTYAFDPNGRRTQKAVSGTITNFVHDGDTEIAEYDGSGTLLRRYVPGPAIDDYVAMVTAAGTKTFFHTDKIGSVVAMSDLSGNLAEGPYTYDAYGYCASGGAACGAGVPFRFTGQRYDAESALYYYRARMYSIITGRFLQTDPVGYKDDLNAYTYVHNDPTDGTDPTGLDTATCYVSTWFGVPLAVSCFNNQTNQYLGPFGSIACYNHWGCGSPSNAQSPVNNENAEDQGHREQGDRQGATVDVDGTGKVHGDLPKPEEIRDDDVQDAIDALEESIETRQTENDSSERGNRNSPDPEERAAWQRWQQHQDRIRQEQELMRRLRKRLPPNFQYPVPGSGQ